MRKLLLALALSLVFTCGADAQPSVKESPTAPDAQPIEADTEAGTGSNSGLNKDSSDPDATTSPGPGIGQNIPSGANSNTNTTTGAHEPLFSDEEITTDSSDPDKTGESASKTKNNKDNNDSRNKSARDDSDSSNKGWESSLIKKQPRKRSVTVEEIDDNGFSLSGEGKIILVCLLTLVALACINMFSKRLVTLFMSGDENSEIRKRANTLSHMVMYFLVAITIALAVVLVLKEVGIDIGPLLAGAGVVGVALGFGAQSIVRDFISGFYIFLEDQIRVGDVIQIADKSGFVEAMTLRLVTLRDENGNVHYIPCGEIKMVTNMTKNFSRYVLKISLPYATDVDKVLEMVKNIDEELRADPEFGDDILEPIEIMGVDQFENNAIVLKARTKTKPIKQWRVGREFNRRLKRRLDKEGIEMPYSNISLYLGDKKENKGEPKL